MMTLLETRLHTNGVAGVMFGGIMMPWIDVCLRAAGHTERSA